MLCDIRRRNKVMFDIAQKRIESAQHGAYVAYICADKLRCLSLSRSFLTDSKYQTTLPIFKLIKTKSIKLPKRNRIFFVLIRLATIWCTSYILISRKNLMNRTYTDVLSDQSLLFKHGFCAAAKSMGTCLLLITLCYFIN